MATDRRAHADAHGHEGGHHHRDVSGGWLRPAVFGAMDGLVTNVSLIAGHALEELGIDPGELPSPVVAAGASLASFAVGALIPLLPYLAGVDVLGVALGLAAVAAVAGGGIVARLTARPFWRGALRQLVLGACAVGITYLIGTLVGQVTG